MSFIRLHLSIKLFFAAVATAYAAYYASTAAQWHFIDNVDLLVHEAGHWLFLPFGDFIHVLMGSGFQVLFPLMFVGYFIRMRLFYSAALALFWVGFNLINVSVYAGDAQAMILPLLGGEHDWNYLLSTLSILRETDLVALGIRTLGIAVLVTAATISLSAAWLDLE